MPVSSDQRTAPADRGPQHDTRRSKPLPSFDEATMLGLQDYWHLYEKHYDELRVILLAELADDPEVGELIRKTPREALEEQGKVSRTVTRRAIVDGQWDAYREHLRAQGLSYGNIGLTFAGWFRVISAFRPHMVRFLMAELGTDTQRLLRAMESMDRLIDYAMSVLGEAYLEAKEVIIAGQREAIGELRTRARYQTVLSSIADGVVTTDPHGNVITVNPAMERLTGVPMDEAIGRQYNEVWPARRGERKLSWEERHLARAIVERTEVHSHGEDVWIRRGDGTDLPIAVTAAPIIAEGGELLGGVNVIRQRDLAPKD